MQSKIELRIPKSSWTVTKFLTNEKTGDKIPVYKKVRKALRKGTPKRRLIKTFQKDGYEYTYHSTRGWRKNKI